MSIIKQPFTIASSRSPMVYQVALPDGLFTNVKWFLRLWIWNGDKNARPTQHNYEFVKYQNEQKQAIFDVSRVVDSAIHHKSYQELTSNNNMGGKHCMWVQAEINFTSTQESGSNIVSNIVLAVSGYYDYPKGINQAFTPYATQDVYKRKVTKSQRVYLPVWLFNDVDRVTITDGLGDSYDVNLNANRNIAANVLNYINVSHDNLILNGLNPINGFSCYVYKFTGGVEVNKAIWHYNYICEPKYTPIILNYINKNGHWDSFVFQKKSSISVNGTAENYQNNHLWPYGDTPAGAMYDTSKGMNRTYNVNAQEMLTLNTDWLEDYENEQVKDILASERLFIQVGGQDLAVVLENRYVEMMSKLNDKLIRYTMTFKRAYYNVNTSAI